MRARLNKREKIDYLTERKRGRPEGSINKTIETKTNINTQVMTIKFVRYWDKFIYLSVIDPISTEEYKMKDSEFIQAVGHFGFYPSGTKWPLYTIESETGHYLVIDWNWKP